MERVLISGASGLIGAALVPTLEQAGAEVVRLVRRPPKSTSEIFWDPFTDLSSAAVSGFDTVIHLAGASVFGRWNAAKKAAILNSRVRGTAAIARAVAAASPKPRVFLSAAAIGFYGNRGDEILNEESPNGTGFLADVAREWESASRSPARAGIRTVNLRIGLVLSAQGGALAKMLPAFKLGLGGRLGPGTQWWSWVHIDDIVGAIHHAIQTESVSGPLNLVSPNPVSNALFTKTLASVLGRPAFFPVPAIALKIAFGADAASEMFLASQRVVPKRLSASGYLFRFPDLRGALESLI